MRDAGTHILYCLSVSWHHTYLRRLRSDAGLHMLFSTLPTDAPLRTHSQWTSYLTADTQ